MIKIITACLVCISFFNISKAQTGYSNFSQETNRINSLAKSYPQLVKVRSLTKTAGGKDIWQITIGSGNAETKPAIVIVGGTEGNYLIGTELAIGFAENLLQGSATDSIKALLNKTTFYIFPNMSPDAMEQYFASLKYERQGNATVTDDDRDGKTNEDGFDDLDGNGKITMMRVESPVGDYKTHPDDPGVLIKADLNKGEKGKYILYTEGSDNDNDNSFNEDGEGGIWLEADTIRAKINTGRGIEYLNNYGSTFVDRSLIDKRYVDSSISAGGGSMVYPGAGIALSTGSAWSTSITDNSANWNTAHTDRLKWDGGATDLVAATGRTSLGGTTIGQNIFTSTNPGAITFGRANADNTFDWLSASAFRTAISAGTGNGDMLLGTAQTITETKTYLDTKFKLRNVANTFNGSFVNTNTADRIYTLPDAAGTIALTSNIKHAKGITIISPTASENVSIWYTTSAITIEQVRTVMLGTSQSVTMVINYGSSRATADGTIVASNTFDSGDSGYQTTGFAQTLNVTSIPANSYIWLTTSATSGTINDFNTTITYVLQ